MYEMTPGWEAYYGSLEMGERKEIFARLIEELPDDGANALRRRMFRNRYPDSGKRGTVMDKFLMFMVFFPSLFEKRASIFTNLEKELKKACETLCLDKADTYTEAEKAALYLEIRNMADLYFWTCKDGGYGRKLFGMVTGDDNSRIRKACEEAWTCSVGIVKAGGKEKEMQIFSEAVQDAFFAFDKRAKAVFAEYEAEQAEKMNSGFFKRKK